MALTAQQVKALKPTGKVYKVRDGKHGLHVRVTVKGSKTWGQRLTLNGKKIDLGLGSIDFMTLSEARAKALDNHAKVRKGIDPRTRKPKASADAPMTFREAQERKLAAQAATWKPTSRSANDWRASMARYVLPVIGDVPVADVTNAMLHEVLMPICEAGKRKQADAVSQRISATLDWAIALEIRERANTVKLVMDQLPKAKPPCHHKALDWRDVPDAISKVNATRIADVSKDAVAFLVLTAARTSEVLGMTFGEVDGATWTIPESRMKAGREHRVPLSKQAKRFIERARKRSGDGLVFPGVNGRLAESTVLNALRRAKVDATGHGFRSSFKDWARENGVDEKVSEFALAHAEGSATVAAYARTDLFEQRVATMQAWADHCLPKTGATLDRFTG